MKETALYIHIPFCDHKCIYCDFYSIITKDNILPFLSSIKKEIKYYAHVYSTDRMITSVFFGGGTPSLMEPGYIESILSSLYKNFNISGDAEITMETNPGTVNLNKLKFIRSTGINRISIGIQSFDDGELKFLTRIHDKAAALRTVRDAKEAGFDNINIDLIFNLPKQTKEIWYGNLKTAVELPVKHISAYSLILERGTILNKMVLDGKVEISGDDYDAELYETAIDYLTENGFLQYEVSNFARPGYECRHNNAYWRYRDYLGFGPSAHSFIDRKRWWNFSSLKHYISDIEKKECAPAGSEYITDQQMFDEYLMLALRSKGLDLNEFEKNFGKSWIKGKNDYIQKLADNNFMIYQDNLLRLTKRGYAVCDEIIKNLLDTNYLK